MIRRLAAAMLLAQAVAPVARAQQYAAAQLHCARYGETARSDIETESGGRTRRSHVERDGAWNFRARDTTGGILLEGWYDSLALRQGSGDTITAPDTDGIIGGRYRGVLSPAGDFRRVASPFVPEEVAEATDAAAALDDLFPRLPTASLAPGARARDAVGLEIERLADSSAGGSTVRRFALRRRSIVNEAVPRGDTTPVPLRQTTTDHARIVWDPRAGLVRLDRETVIEATIPVGGRIRSPVRSRVMQQASLVRLPPAPGCDFIFGEPQPRPASGAKVR